MATERNVYLLVPNVIGYVRILLNLVALGYALRDYKTSLTCYFASALLDAADGYAARVLGQSSLFGAVLDMVTDRTATATLCVVLAHLYPSFLLHFCVLIMLDIFSHWAHVYASALQASTHKSSTNWIVRMYYYKPVLFLVCAGNELFYMCVPRAASLHAIVHAPRSLPLQSFTRRSGFSTSWRLKRARRWQRLPSQCWAKEQYPGCRQGSLPVSPSSSSSS